MSTYHITHERLKKPSGVSKLNGTVGYNFSIHHRIPIIDGRVKSPISGKMKSVATILSAYPAITTAKLPSINGNEILFLLLPSINANGRHSYNYMYLIDQL